MVDCNPMKTVTCQALAEVHTGRSDPSGTVPTVPTASGPGTRRIRTAHTRTATATRPAHRPNAGRQLPNSSDSGTARPAARAADAFITEVLTPVSREIREGWSRRMMAGTRTLPTATEAPISAVPTHRAGSGERERMTIPAHSTTIATSTIRSTPQRAAGPWTRGETRAKPRSGSAPNSPNVEPDNPVVSPICPRTEPTEVRAGRRQAATRKRAARTSAPWDPVRTVVLECMEPRCGGAD